MSKAFSFVGGILLVLCCAVTLSASRFQSTQIPGQEIVRTYSFPAADLYPNSYEISGTGETILFCTGARAWDSDPNDLYLFNGPQQSIKKILTSKYLDFWPLPNPHQFAVIADLGLYFLKDDGTLTGPVVGIERYVTSRRLHGTRDGKYIVFTSGRPVTDERDPNYYDTGFKSITVVDLNTLTTKQFPVRTPAYLFQMRPSDDKILVSDAENEQTSKSETVTVYELDGTLLETRRDMHGIRLSPSGRYSTPDSSTSHIVGTPAFLWESSTGKVIFKFPTVKSRKNWDGSDSVRGWNPADEDLLLVAHYEFLRHVTQYSSVLLLYSISQRTIVKRFYDTRAVWAPDGKSLVYFQDQRFVFDKVVP